MLSTNLKKMVVVVLKLGMIVLFFSRLFYPHIGGVEKHVMEISKILVKKGHKVIVVTEESFSEDKTSRLVPLSGTHSKNKSSALSKYQSRNLSDKSMEEIEGIEIYRINAGQEDWFKKFRIWLWLWKHQSLIKQADIVHAHDVFFWYLPFRFLFPKKKVYTTFHGYEGNSLPSKKAIFMHKFAEKLSYGNICVGDYLKKWYGTRTDFVSYGGADINKIRNPKSEIRNKFKIQSFDKLRTKFKIIFIGRLEDETGIVEYLRAVKILAQKGYKIKLDVLGDGSLRREAEDFCRKNKLNVNFYGFVNNTQDFLSKSDFVFTSRYLGILESFANKKLVFSVYNNDIKRDYLEMAPFSKFIVIAKSAEVISSKFIYYLKNFNEEKKMVEKADDFVRDQTWDKVSQLYINLWRKKE